MPPTAVLTHDDQSAPVVIVGGGPVGLTLALDLGQRGHRVVLLNRLDFIAGGSKAICFAKRTLDIWHRLGVADLMIDRGMVWETGKVFWGASDAPIYTFDLLAVKDQRNPAFINLQQYHVETILVDALARLPNVDIRWGHRVTNLDADARAPRLQVAGPDGAYVLTADWLVACDGHRSTIRNALALDFEGRVFEDNFLIADIKMKGEWPPERWFWFDPPFNPGQSALLHKQPDDIWRLDFQLGWGIDRDACTRPENVEPLIRGMLGSDVAFEQEWYSVYTFQCRRMEHFVHDRVIFAGDAAHLVSPFGARGCNGGVADADNLAWKLDAVLDHRAPPMLLDSYGFEAAVMADMNILNSTRSTDFMTPKSTVSHAFRNAVLELARDHPFARPLVNSGRLSTAVHFPSSSWVTADLADEAWAGVAPGSQALDARLNDGWLLERLGGDFVVLTSGAIEDPPIGARMVLLDEVGDPTGMVAARYDLKPGSAYLFRPDQYVAARWRRPTRAMVQRALDRAHGRP